MFRIGEFSKLGKTTVKTLRYYDSEGLLQPEHTDSFTGYRYYTAAQLAVLHKIQSFRGMGLTVDETRRALKGADVAEILRSRRAELVADIAKQQACVSRIDFILSGKEDFMNYQVTIKKIEDCIVYSKKLTLKNYDELFIKIPTVGVQLAEKYPDLKCALPEYCFCANLDGEYRESDIHVEFCEAVTEMKQDFDDVHFKRLLPCTVASIMHRGGYNSIGGAYAYVFKWIEENGYVPVGEVRESYIEGIWSSEHEEDWLTEIQVPVVPESEVEHLYGETPQYDEYKKKDKGQASFKWLNDIFAEFAKIRHTSPGSPEAQALAARLQQSITDNMYTCTPEILTCLGEMYVSDERFKENIDRHGAGTAQFVHDTIALFKKG